LRDLTGWKLGFEGSKEVAGALRAEALASLVGVGAVVWRVLGWGRR
jgi:hypothetical protein